MIPKRALRFTSILGAICALTLTKFASAAESEAQLKAEARVTQAQMTALRKAQGGTIKSVEIEREHGHLVWSFDISMPHSKNITEILVDAMTGKILTTQIESPADQAREATADKKSTK